MARPSQSASSGASSSAAGRAPRLADIAAAAGVSIATVSRALDDHPAITPETKQRVRALALAQGYPLRENAGPRAPRGRRRRAATKGSVCLIMPVALPAGRPLANTFELNLLGGIGAAMRDRGLDFSVAAQAPYDDASLLRFMQAQRHDGVILFGQSQYHHGLNTLADSGVPFVVWGVAAPGQRYCSVGSDNVRCGFTAAEHLLRQGRRNLVFLGHAAAITTAQTGVSQLAERMAGFRAALAAIPGASGQTVVRPCSDGAQAGRDGVAALVAAKAAFDGIVASSDMVALGAMEALHAAGLRVPHDVAVIGYDDCEIAQWVRPRLSTMRQDPILAGNLLVAKILRAMDGYAIESVRLPTELVVRESCGGLAAPATSANTLTAR
ncbi:LacI family DNA-binding transcriptional regulator [Novosphingobium pokkalii]|uniref:LacI family DNA-binding transcriptional regulator n=1 Tax=Novosphingobium pokkalii TaxID=1770194 RepID=A0ABV7V1J1_9SPHN|nr:LacI family DNA-binding transcriptional regulator [Novosphingobium pokkalii]GHC83371.1 LacI family transcriptional regulator [Novosphingobium pokkalii]